MILHQDKSDDYDAAWLASLDRPCRLCGTSGMTEAFDLGVQSIGSYFPASPSEHVPSAPLRLMYCPECSLVQLSHGCDHEDIYRSGNYGYRSGQNPQMVEHLRAKAAKLTEECGLRPGDVVVDVGANDGTFLGSFSSEFRRVGFDPTAPQFAEFFPPGVVVLDELFTAKPHPALSGRAKLITSNSVLYDLEDPVAFAQDVAECLTEDGYWHFEQCYLPTMLATTGYDTICHEHLTYFTLKTVRAILDRVGMHIVDVEYNETNGGSFAVTAQKDRASLGTSTTVDGARVAAKPLDLSRWDRPTSKDDPFGHNPPRREQSTTLLDLARFAERSLRHRTDLANLIDALNRTGKRVGALGASTKGNTLLQFLDLGPDQIEAVGEVNPQKVGRVTPGTHIPIVKDDDVMDCDFLLVLPWHFRDSFVERYRSFTESGGHLIFPLPTIEIVGKQ